MAEKHKLSRRRSIVVWTLIVVASVVTLLMTLTFWLKRQVLDNNSWRKASTQLVQNQDVQSSVSTLVVNQLYENVDVGQALSDRLPEQVKALGPTLAAALRQPATNAVEALLDRPKVQQLFIEASSRAQQKLVNVLEDKTGYGISTGNGEVTIDLHQLVVELGTNLGISQERLDKLPAKAGVINLMSSDQLGAAQKGVKLVHVISGFFVILVLVLYALAIYLARGRRRETLRNVGWAVIVVSVLTLVAAPLHRQLRRRCADPVHRREAGQGDLVDRQLDSRPDRAGRRSVRSNHGARSRARRSDAGGDRSPPLDGSVPQRAARPRVDGAHARRSRS